MPLNLFFAKHICYSRHAVPLYFIYIFYLKLSALLWNRMLCFFLLFMEYLLRYIIPNGTRCMYLNYVEFCDIICMIHVFYNVSHKKVNVDGKFLITKNSFYQKDAKWTKGIVFNFVTHVLLLVQLKTFIFHLHRRFGSPFMKR